MAARSEAVVVHESRINFSEIEAELGEDRKYPTDGPNGALTQLGHWLESLILVVGCYSCRPERGALNEKED